MHFFRIPALAALAIVCCLTIAIAQSGPAVATLVRTEGVVYLNDQLVAADTAAIALSADIARIRTEAGRAIVSLKRGGTLALGDRSTANLRANGGYNFNRMELIAGSAMLASGESSPQLACGTEVRLSSGGVFRFDVLEPERVDGSARCDLRVYEGAASTPGVSVTYVLRSGQRMTLNRRAGDMIPVLPLSRDSQDEFERWSRQQLASDRK